MEFSRFDLELSKLDLEFSKLGKSFSSFDQDLSRSAKTFANPISTPVSLRTDAPKSQNRRPDPILRHL